jgi:hypothetical protein
LKEEKKIVKSVKHVKNKSCSSANLMNNHAKLSVITAKNVKDIDIHSGTEPSAQNAHK